MSNIRPIGPFAQFNQSDIFFPTTMREIQGRSQNGFDLPMPDFRGVYRADENGNPVPLGVVGAGYTPVAMRDLCNVVEQAATKSVPTEALTDIRVADEVGRNGAFVSRKYRFPVSRDIQYGGNYGSDSIVVKPGMKTGTTVAFLLKVSTAYDGSGSIKLYTGSEDLVCLNGLVVAHDVDAVARRHTRNVMAALPKFAEVVSKGVERFTENCEIWQKWASTSVTPDQAKAVIEAMPGMSKHRAKVMMQRVEQEFVDRGEHAFALMSALTFFSSHNSEEFTVRKTGNDNVAEALVARQEQVNRWLASEPFQRLVA